MARIPGHTEGAGTVGHTGQTEFISRLLPHCHVRTYPARSTILRQGDPAAALCYIVSGSVTVLLEDDRGHEIVLAYLDAGEFFGELGLFNRDHNRIALVRARTEVEIAQISYDRLRGMDDLYTGLVSAMTGALAERLCNTNQKLCDLAFMDVSGRVARALLDLCAQDAAESQADGIRVRCTRQEIARLVGCSREMVGKVLKDMEQQELVRAEGRSIVVLGRHDGLLAG